MRRGVLLLNLGTPANPSVYHVFRYLIEFLTDPRVVDLPWFIRYPLVLAIIAPFRSRASSEAYQSIWDAQKGSPLRFHTEAMVEGLQAQLGDDYTVRYAMRYGTPSIQSVIETMAPSCDHITLLPLFPHYASSSSGSALAKALSVLSQQTNIPNITLCADYFDHPDYIEALKHSVTTHATEQPVDRWLMSFHGLPVSHIEASCQAPCKDHGPCPKVDAKRRFCYRAQCYQTARVLAQQLGLKEQDYCVTFQSRLGKTPWIQPYTDQTLMDLRKEGVENLRILCPSFTADCLETLEEIGIAGKEAWQKAGGQHYELIPCLNQDKKWIAFLTQLVIESSQNQLNTTSITHTGA